MREEIFWGNFRQLGFFPCPLFTPTYLLSIDFCFWHHLLFIFSFISEHRCHFKETKESSEFFPSLRHVNYIEYFLLNNSFWRGILILWYIQEMWSDFLFICCFALLRFPSYRIKMASVCFFRNNSSSGIWNFKLLKSCVSKKDLKKEVALRFSKD